MYFSGKVTNSICHYLQNKGISQEKFQELTELPPEFYRDPSAWLDAHEVECFLAALDAVCSTELKEDNILQTVGHNNYELRTWGVLDSVLRMMQQPQDIFTQPQRFISYFVSPAPPIGNIQRGKNQISFDLPISYNEYPFVASYLSAALEVLPVFMGHEMAQVEWSGTTLSVCWDKSQAQLFENSEASPKPELMQSILNDLEVADRKLDAKSLHMKNLEEKVEAYEQELAGLRVDSGWGNEEKREIKNSVRKLGDYLARAQQLVTLLGLSKDRDPQLNEALRRMDWENVTTNYPAVIKDIFTQLDREPEEPKPKEKKLSPVVGKRSSRKSQMDLNGLIEKLVQSNEKLLPDGAKMHSMLFLDRPISAYPGKLELALGKLLGGAVKHLDDRGVIRVVVRPKGPRAEIEICDNGSHVQAPIEGWDKDIQLAESIVKLHRGRLSHDSAHGASSTYRIEIPMQ